MPGPKEPDILASFISHLLQSSRISCPMPDCNEEYLALNNTIHGHFRSKHSNVIQGEDIATLIRDVKKGRIPRAQGVDSSSTRDLGGGAQGMTDEAGPSYKRRKSPVNSPSKSPRPQSRAQLYRRVPQQDKLHSSSSLDRTKQNSATPPDEDGDTPQLIKQLEGRPISQEQLVAEVKGIYAGLMMVESKCIEMIKECFEKHTKLNNEQWQALIALHRTLLHEHHDFFLASQYPSASPELKRLASRYAMPARMWRHGIHSFLELLRKRLPGSLEHMLTFIYLAYSMMALLYETVPAFEDTWIECLGDLGRYRMAIEDEDIRDREVWTSVSRHWYSKASDKAPTTGRLYHHLAILARPNALQQLFFYAKSLCVPVPFGSAKESIMTLFDPILAAGNYQHNRLSPIDVAFVKTHGILFSHKQLENFRLVVGEFLGGLDNHISQMAKGWMEAGYYIAIANCCALLSYGKDDNNVIMRSIQGQEDETQDAGMASGVDDVEPSRDFEDALILAMGTHEVVFNRWDDVNVLPYTHVVMAFMFHLISLPNAWQHIEHLFLWKLLSLMLNGLLETYNTYDRIYSDEFPRESNDPPRPVPEDFALQGLVFVDHYFPSDWFANDKIDYDEKYFEMASMTNVRKERILWLGYRIAQSGKGLTYDKGTPSFGVFPQYEKEMDIISRNTYSINTSDVAGDAMNIDEYP